MIKKIIYIFIFIYMLDKLRKLFYIVLIFILVLMTWLSIWQGISKKEFDYTKSKMEENYWKKIDSMSWELLLVKKDLDSMENYVNTLQKSLLKITDKQWNLININWDDNFYYLDFDEREKLMDWFSFVDNFNNSNNEILKELWFFLLFKKDDNFVYLNKDFEKNNIENKEEIYVCKLRENQIWDTYFHTNKDKVFNDWIENCKEYKNWKLKEEDLKKLEKDVNNIFSKWKKYEFIK